MMIILKRLFERISGGGKEVQWVSWKDNSLPDVDIVIFSDERGVPHATVVKRGQENVRLGSFVITSKKAPSSGDDIIESKVEKWLLGPAYKEAIAKWANQPYRDFPKATNWEILRGSWNSSNDRRVQI